MNKCNMNKCVAPNTLIFIKIMSHSAYIISPVTLVGVNSAKHLRFLFECLM